MDLSVKVNQPNFGMAVLIDDSAKAIIKKQTMGLSPKKFDKFWNKLNEKIEQEKDNPVNTIIRKAKYRDALAAEVVDSNADTAIKNYVITQGLIHRNGSLKFLDRGTARAQKINNANQNLDKIATAEEKDFYPGSIAPDLESNE